jgi:hypothetical protein
VLHNLKAGGVEPQLDGHVVGALEVDRVVRGYGGVRVEHTHLVVDPQRGLFALLGVEDRGEMGILAAHKAGRAGHDDVVAAVRVGAEVRPVLGVERQQPALLDGGFAPLRDDRLLGLA